MKQILVYADSLSWGIVPGTRQRLTFDARWPGVMENTLRVRGVATRVFEDCLNGRTTAWDDPFRPGRNGIMGIEQVIEMHSPLDLVIVMLGTNDFQTGRAHAARHSAEGIGALIDSVRRAPVEPGMPIPPVLIVVPPAIAMPDGPVMPKFVGGQDRCVGLAAAYGDIARAHGCLVFDAGTVTTTSRRDGVHLDADQHIALGEAIADIVQAMLDREESESIAAEIPATRSSDVSSR
ncbi:GDSL family lipase [Trinickia dabaoshanensis]|uniref:GDSL family lipase n=1 Tax=Trinickia dabaoshanensis TaxID=564714 RepID=A0A2N7W310_9BURK|nr:SGNH/GDSL hydrolase family protein [Trinickia dabaoshanensis]PMS23795.1 GDSL family lipase [Trinickia dabaoshanensis]